MAQTLGDGVIDIEQTARLAGVELPAGSKVPIEWLDYAFVNKCQDR